MKYDEAKHIALSIIKMYHLDGTGDYDDYSEPLINHRYGPENKSYSYAREYRPRVQHEGDGTISVLIEAPAHAVIPVHLSLHRLDIGNFIAEIYSAINNFNVDQYFTDTWNSIYQDNNDGYESDIKPDQLYVAIEKDAEFFHRIASEIADAEYDITEYINAGNAEAEN